MAVVLRGAYFVGTNPHRIASMSVTRRDFLGAGAAAAATAALARTAEAATTLAGLGPHAADALPTFAAASRPVVVSSANGIRGVAKAYEQIVAGVDTLDAIIAGVNIQELDPTDQSVGLGGLPNAEGVVQLDASCMHGPTKRAGAVGCLEGIATPSLVAKAVMDYTTHVLLVGHDAKRFALQLGFKEQDLLTEQSRQDWLKWRAKQNPNDNYLDYDDPIKIKYTTGTINMNAVNAAGDISSVTTTSGLAWKVPGRVGDSAIHGAGQYCDNTVGAAGSTGLGEANIKACGGMLIVEGMRNGLEPAAAGLKALERVVSLTEKRLLDDKGRPKFQIQYYIVHKDGRYAGASMYPSPFAVADAKGARIEQCVSLYKASEQPR
jgi:N4-(beta-N-acetylglucosaminyl)-L-asparaginase